jgi:ABC-type transport system substrate-binding protein
MMTRKTISLFLLAVLVGLLASGLTGCGATPAPTEPPAPAPTEPPAPAPTEPPAPTPTEEPAVKRVLTIAASTEPTSFDSGAGGDFQNYALNLFMFHNLFEQDEKGVPQPMLAESYSVEEDNLTWTFKLKEGIEFSDGTPFTSEAVCFTVDQLIAPDSPKPHASSWAPVGECKVVDDYTVQLITKEPYAAVVSHIVSGGYPGVMLSPSMGEYGDEMGLHPIGTGPYVLKEWIRGDRVILVPNENFSEVLGPKPYYDEIIWRVVPEDTTRILMLETGEVDVAYSVPPEMVESVDAKPDLNVVSVAGLWNWYLFDVNKPPLDDVRVRQALNHAVDKQLIIDTLLEGRAKIATGPIGSAFGGFEPVGTYEYDPDKAKQLLEEAGAAGAHIVVHSPSGRYPNDSKVGEAVVAQLQEVGLDAELTVIGDWPAYMQTIWDEEPMVSFLGWQATPIQSFFFRTLACEGGNWNLGPYCDPELDELILKTGAAVDAEEYKELATELQTTIFERAIGLYMYNVSIDTGIRAGIEGVYAQPNTLLQFRNAYGAE